MKPRGPEDGAWLAWNGAAIALGQLGNSLLLPALPRLAEDFHVPFPQSGLAITVYFTLFAVGSLVAGPLSDRYGRRLPLLAGLLLLALASVAVAAAATFTALLLARAAQAAGAAGTPVIARAMARDRLNGVPLTRLLGLLSLLMVVSSVLGPIIGGYVAAHADWRYGFYGLGAAGLAWCGLGLLLLEETRAVPAGRRPGLLPFAAFRAVLAAASFRAGAGGLILYFFVFGAVYVGTPLVFMERYGLSSIDFGYSFAGVALATAVGSLTAARLKRRLGDPVVVRLAAELSLLAGLIWVDCALSSAGCVWAAMGGLALYGVAFGWILPLATAHALADAGDRAGAASSLLGFLQIGASAAGSAVVGAMDPGSEWPLACALLLTGLAALAGAGRLKSVS